jgi:hypothetical protein
VTPGVIIVRIGHEYRADEAAAGAEGRGLLPVDGEPLRQVDELLAPAVEETLKFLELKPRTPEWSSWRGGTRM